MLRKTKSVENNNMPAPSMGEKTIIGEQISIEGCIQGKGDLVIDGSIKGSIELESRLQGGDHQGGRLHR
jgi:cytoskeletal protein CcmA (bactofilin family)